MKLAQEIKCSAILKAADALPGLKNEQLIILANLAEKLTPFHKERVRFIRNLIEENHPSTELIKRALGDTNKQCRRGFIKNLVLKGILWDQQEKRMAAKKIGLTVPTSVLISPSMRCNLSCTGCYAGNYSKKDDLDFETFDRVIGEGKEMGVRFFTILGGEPLVYPRLFEIFEKHNDTYFVMFTNGTLLTDEKAEKISRLGNVAPIISIEGYEQHTDKRRGEGVHKKVLLAMDRLKEKGVIFGFSCAVTKKNIKTISSDAFIDMMIKKGAFIGWLFLYMPVGKAPDIKLMPTPKQRRYLYERVKDIRGKKQVFLVDFWNDAPFVGGCIAGKEYIHITSKGDVEPCIFTHFAVDNIKNKSLKEVMESEFFKELRKRQPYNENLFMPCMWIDNPDVARNLHKKFGLKPTHEGAEEILIRKNIRKHLDEYSKETAKLYEEPWEEMKETLNDKGSFLA